MKKTSARKGRRGAARKNGEISAARMIDEISGAGDWRRDMLARLRAIIRAADPQIVETAKWRKVSNPGGVPVWERDGIICTGETYRNAVKLTFAYGASLKDPARLFNASLEGGTRRAIDLHEGDRINEKALTALVRAAVARNMAKAKKS